MNKFLLFSIVSLLSLNGMKAQTTEVISFTVEEGAQVDYIYLYTTESIQLTIDYGGGDGVETKTTNANQLNGIGSSSTPKKTVGTEVKIFCPTDKVDKITKFYNQIKSPKAMTALDVSQSKLNEIGIAHTKLSALDISGLTTLGRLEWKGNYKENGEEGEVFYATLNVAGCTSLGDLTCENTIASITGLTTAKPKISKLILSNNKLQSINLTGQTEILSLNIANNDLETLAIPGGFGDYLNISNNKRLTTFPTAADGYIRTLTTLIMDSVHVTNMNTVLAKLGATRMAYLSCINTGLTSLDFLQGLTSVKTFMCSDNNLTFATLALPSNVPGITNYVYAPQNPVQINTDYTEDAPIDLSGLIIAGGTTTYQWYQGGNLLATGYSVLDGVSTFSGEYDGIHCQMTNDLFPAFNANPLKTTLTNVSQLTSINKEEADALNIYSEKGNIIIVSDKGAACSIYTSTGQLVKSVRLTDGANSIAVPSGIYLIKVDADNISSTKKVSVI